MHNVNYHICGTASVTRGPANQTETLETRPTAPITQPGDQPSLPEDVVSAENAERQKSTLAQRHTSGSHAVLDRGQCEACYIKLTQHRDESVSLNSEHGCQSSPVAAAQSLS